MGVKHNLVMPKLGLTMTGGILTEWRVEPGQRVRQGEVLFVVETEKVANAIEASADGALFFDTAGGEPLGVRLTEATKGWRKFTLFRRVPATGEMRVTAALTGVGTVYFDDLTIEPLNSR